MSRTKGLPIVLLAVLAAVAVVIFSCPASASANETTLRDPLLAPEGRCGKVDMNPRARLRAQYRSMICYINYARRKAGLNRLKINRKLQRAAARKSLDLHRCSFSHEACGREMIHWPKRFGYTNNPDGWSVGENLVYSYTTRSWHWHQGVRYQFYCWLKSEGHRKNLVRPDWKTMGIAPVRVVRPNFKAVYWTNIFGSY